MNLIGNFYTINGNYRSVTIHTIFSYFSLYFWRLLTQHIFFSFFLQSSWLHIYFLCCILACSFMCSRFVLVRIVFLEKLQICHLAPASPTSINKCNTDFDLSDFSLLLTVAVFVFLIRLMGYTRSHCYDWCCARPMGKVMLTRCQINCWC